MRLIDLTGERFGRLTVIERAKDYRSGVYPWSPPGKKFNVEPR